MNLVERFEKFIIELGTPVTVMSKKLRLSPQSLYAWKKGKLKLSDSTLNRIDTYLKQYGF